jgi:hypothetical protein
MTFMKTIIAPADFSANSLNAVNYAAGMANMLVLLNPICTCIPGSLCGGASKTPDNP